MIGPNNVFATRGPTDRLICVSFSAEPGLMFYTTEELLHFNQDTQYVLPPIEIYNRIMKALDILGQAPVAGHC